MRYVMVTGPMGAGKSTFMRSLPKPRGNFVAPANVPDMLLDHACELSKYMFYEIDAPDNHFVELWNYLNENTPDTERIIILNRVNKIGKKWKDYAQETVMCVGIGETIDEETAIASENDILAVLNHIKERYG